MRGSMDQQPIILDAIDDSIVKNPALVTRRQRTHSDALRGEGRSRNNLKEFVKNQKETRSEKVIDSDPEDTAKRNSSRYPSPTKSGEKNSLRDNITPQPKPRFVELKAEALGDQRRNTESASSQSRPRFDDQRRLSSREYVAISPMTSKPTSRNGSEKSFGSRPVSPAQSQRSFSPARSPRSAYPPVTYDSAQNKRSSGHYSRPGSSSGSRPSSPKPFDTQIMDDRTRRVPSFPLAGEERSKGPSRLSASMTPRSPDVEAQSPHGRTMFAAPAKSGSALPYPVDDMMIMPSEEDHKYRPRTLEDSPISKIPAYASTSDFEKRSSRPQMMSRHSTDGRGLLINTGSPLIDKTSMTPPLSAKGSVRASKPPPSCPRAHFTRGHDDWYTLENNTEYHICPSCLEGNFSSTTFRKNFRPAARKDPSLKIKCNFASPWMRIAWLLTLQQQRSDFDLFYAMARAIGKEKDHPCPGEYSETRNWYSFVDKRGSHVDKFDVCSCDVRKLEALLPSMRGMLTRRDHGPHGPYTRKCDLRVGSKRFTEHLDFLVDLDTEARMTRRSPDILRFVDFVRQRAELPECARDAMLDHASWHFAPQLPEFTVCKECYSSVVWPAIADGSPVAARISRTPQLIHEDKGRRRNIGLNASLEAFGTSCQLYSPRMRKVFDRAVHSGDFDYLVQKALERKDIELDLQRKTAALRRLSQERARQGNGTGLQSEYAKISEQWQRME